jgi:predicted transcriptional regulator
MILMNQGIDVDLIAKRMKSSVTTIRKVLQEKYFIEKLDSLRREVRAKYIDKQVEVYESDTVKEARDVLNKAALEAATKLKQLAKNGLPENRVQLDACRDLLDRVGLKAIQVVENRERPLSPEEVVSVKATLTEVTTIIERIENKANPFVIGRDRLDSVPTQKAQDA